MMTNASTSSPVSGTGLAFSQSMVQAMGGTLGVKSAVDQGSTFWIELPLAENPGAQAGTNSGFHRRF